MVTVIMKNEIITRYRNKESQRSIARALNCSRNTVKKYVDDYLGIALKLENETNIGTIALLQKEMCEPPKTKSHTRARPAFTEAVRLRIYGTCLN